MTTARIVRLHPGDEARVVAASPLFDHPATTEAATTMLAQDNHYLVIAYDGEAPIGFVSGVAMTHPDKGTEMFLYELAVDPAHRRLGVGRALVETLAAEARAAGFYGMWVLTDRDNEAAMATYELSGVARQESDHVMIGWTF